MRNGIDETGNNHPQKLVETNCSSISRYFRATFALLGGGVLAS